MLIEHSVDGAIIPQRPRDGYIDATRLCKQAGKLFGNYNQTAQTQAFLSELSAVIGIPITALVQVVQVVQGGQPELQGTWVHPKVAVHLGQWLSPAFAVQVSEWVFDWMSGNVRSYMPEHVQRYMKNRAKIPITHFSMLNEIYLNLLAPLEDYGIRPPDKIMPDISTGLMFSGFLRSKGIEPKLFPTYQHEFIDSLRPTVQARLYPLEYLADFRKYFNETWLPQKALGYFGEKFPKALPFLTLIKQLPSP